MTANSDLAIIIPAILGLATLIVGFGRSLSVHAGDITKHPINVDKLVTVVNCEEIQKRMGLERAELGKQITLIDLHNQQRHEDMKCYVEKILRGRIKKVIDSEDSNTENPSRH